jgi:hypothetical protein
MTVHESKLKSTDAQRHIAPASIIARKSNASELSSAGMLRQRLGKQGFQRLMSEIVGHSQGSAQTRSPAIQAKLTVSRPGDAHEHEEEDKVTAV